MLMLGVGHLGGLDTCAQSCLVLFSWAGVVPGSRCALVSWVGVVPLRMLYAGELDGLGTCVSQHVLVNCVGLVPVPECLIPGPGICTRDVGGPGTCAGQLNGLGTCTWDGELHS